MAKFLAVKKLKLESKISLALQNSDSPNLAATLALEDA